MRKHQPLQWSPKIVGERLIEAVKWAHYASGPVGPSGVKSSMPAFALTFEERLAEGWGLPDFPEHDEGQERRIFIQPSPAKISAMMDTLEWPVRYLSDRPGDARALSLWVRCRAYGNDFSEAIDRRQYLSRGAAYRMRDRSLTLISVALDRDGVPV